jgi:hypothetical protein
VLRVRREMFMENVASLSVLIRDLWGCWEIGAGGFGNGLRHCG